MRYIDSMISYSQDPGQHGVADGSGRLEIHVETHNIPRG